MCGHAGYFLVNKNKKPDENVRKVFMNTFLTAQLRGLHSSGVGVIWRAHTKRTKKHDRHGAFIEKERASPAFVMNNASVTLSERASKNHDVPFPSAMIGHCRHATKGAITKENAHPFSFGNNRFIAAHNGTIENPIDVYKKLTTEGTPLTDTKEKLYPEPENVTDSELILYCIYRYGIDAVYPLIRGAWAFIWFDVDKQEINFIRNNQRTLFYTADPSTEAVFWSSEFMMLEFAWRREHRDVYVNGQVKAFDIHKLYTFSITRDRILHHNEKDTLKWSSVRELKPYEVTYKPYTMYYPAAESAKTFKQKQEERMMEVDAGFFGLFRPNLFKKPEDKVIAALPPPLAKEEEEEVDDTEYCIHCGDMIEEDRDDNIVIDGVGILGGCCSNDFNAVSDTIDNHEKASRNMELLRRAMELHENGRTGQGVMYAH